MTPAESIPRMNHRRDLLRGCLRCGGLLALGGVASALGWRGSYGKCLRTDPCGGCPMFSACGLPKALETKNPPLPAANRTAVKPTSSHV